MIRIDKLNFSSKIMIIAEALAYDQVRISGIYYCYPDGTISKTGKNLDRFLNKFGFTVHPGGFNYVYPTEIVHCCPREFNKIRRPTKVEIENCLARGFLRKEIEIIKPRIIFLMGKTSYETFYKYFLNRKPQLALTEKINEISATGVFDKYHDIAVIPLQHPSGANPNFHRMLDNGRLFWYINKILNQ